MAAFELHCVVGTDFCITTGDVVEGLGIFSDLLRCFESNAVWALLVTTLLTPLENSKILTLIHFFEKRKLIINFHNLDLLFYLVFSS